MSMIMPVLGAASQGHGATPLRAHASLAGLWRWKILETDDPCEQPAGGSSRPDFRSSQMRP